MILRQHIGNYHPDMNPGIDTTNLMQDINEAYAILKDETKRKRYDIEYNLFKQQHSKAEDNPHTEETTSEKTETTSETWSYDYEVHDEDLENDIKTARKYAHDLVDEFMKEFKKTSKVAVAGAWENAKGYIIAAIIMTIISLIIMYN